MDVRGVTEVKAILHYGMFQASIEIREPKMDLWVVEPIEPTEVLDSRVVLDPEYLEKTRIGKLRFQLVSSPRVGENLEYRFVGKE